MKIRIATYNVENLFRRSRILNLRDENRSSELLAKVRELQTLIDKVGYTASVRNDVFSISAELLQYVDFRVDLGSFGTWKKETVSGSQVTGWRMFKSCKGRGSWVGQIVFREEDFSDVQRKNTALVVKEISVDILCLVEIEGMDALGLFNRSALGKRYSQFISIDSPNDRGISMSGASRSRSCCRSELTSSIRGRPANPSSVATAWKLPSAFLRPRRCTCCVTTSRARGS